MPNFHFLKLNPPHPKISEITLKPVNETDVNVRVLLPIVKFQYKI